jgi:hypothetical protein
MKVSKGGGEEREREECIHRDSLWWDEGFSARIREILIVVNLDELWLFFLVLT